MALNWIRMFSRLDLVLKVVAVLMILCFPIIGSRSIGGSHGSGSVASGGGVLVTFDPPPNKIVAPEPFYDETEPISNSSSDNIDTSSNPCTLVSMSLIDEKDGKLMTYEEKSLISISHNVFDVSHGIVPNILYKVDLEIPSGHEYTLEYWINGLVEDRKRRHQRDHRDILELYFNSSTRSTPEQVIFCSKSSLGGQNQDSTSILISFNWFINGNNIILPSSTSTKGLPSNIVFRLRFRSIVEKTTSVFEQNLSVIMRPDCYLVMKIFDSTTLSLNSLWNSETDNKGVNCTVLLLPRTHFGLEIRIANFSIYGMRDICKGRYISFSQPKFHSLNNVGGGDKIGLGENSNEFPIPSLLSPLERMFCGKLEDYTKEERLLTFTSESALSRLQSKTSDSPFVWNDNGKSESSDDKRININPSSGILLQVNLPSLIKPREMFILELSSLNPCQRVTMIDLDGEIKYSKNYGNEECSIVIHVPYGNKIITKMTLSRMNREEGVDIDIGAGRSTGASTETSEQESKPEYSESNSINEEMDTSYNGSNNNINYYNYNDSSDLDFEYLENMDNSIPQPSYECPMNLDLKSGESTTVKSARNGSGGSESEDRSNAVVEKQYMFIKAEDSVSGSEFTWCFGDGNSNSLAQHKRAWKSSGNKVKIRFKLKNFDLFHLTYQSVKIPEITGECDRGWVKVESGCVTLVEKPSTWTFAEESCQFKSAHLVTISRESEEYNVQKIITESALFHPSRAYWIGANDRESEGNFQWASGLPFSYKNWFIGWTHKRNEIVNAQPNDDGWSGQDCVEIRQIFNPESFQLEKPLSSFFLGESGSSSGKPHLHNTRADPRFYWNDRNCEVKNFYICERATRKSKKELSCNRTLQLNSPQSESLMVTSPAYPSSYPENTVCVTTVETPPGYKIVMSFDEFVLEESVSCQYDSLEISEMQGKVAGEEAKVRVGTFNNLKKICGDWTRKLKLLRYTSSSSRSPTTLSLKFESDFSHQFSGFKAKIWAEKDVSEQCSDQQMKKFGSHCYLTVSFPAVNWVTAQQICSSLQAKLASVLSLEEWHFITRSLTTVSASGYDKKSTFWIGGSIDQNSQLVWVDTMPFNFSAFHPSDLQTISEWKCLRIYWFQGGKGDFAWRLADCNQLSGYVCKKKAQDDVGHKASRTYSGTGGKQSSPNYPSNYYNNLDYTYHLVAPRGTQIVIRFSHLDIEDQEDCLYDHIEFVDKKTKNSTRFCGTYASSELDKLDYVSSSNEVDVIFNTDFSDTLTGFEIIWRAVDVTGCISGKTILTGLGGNGFPIHDASIHSPNFPHFNLPHLNCFYTIVAPVDQRIWLTFQVFEFGESNVYGSDCTEQDHVTIDLEAEEIMPLEISNEEENNGKKRTIILCGNLTSAPYRTSFVSTKERMRIRVVSPRGKSGRGFLGIFKAIPGRLVESLTVATSPNKSLSLTSINYPYGPPENTNLTVAFSSPPNYVLTVNINGTANCPNTVKSFLEIRDPYHGTNGTTWKLCQLHEPGSNDLRQGIKVVNDNDRMGRNEISLEDSHMNTAISFRSTFNRLDIRQVYLPGFQGNKWKADIGTVLDHSFKAKVLADGDRLLQLDGCINSPCTNGGSCVSNGGKHVCRCPTPFTGPFCGLSLCDLNPCLFGQCILTEKAIKCECQLGYGGERCDRRMKPCDDSPCSGHGDCREVNQTSYKCICFAWWEGPQCEARMLVIPYKPLSQRMIEEPFWLGLITVSLVLGVIGLIWCMKRHFPEKLEKLLNEDLDKTRGISWVSGRSPSSFRTGGGSSVREPIPGTSQQAISPPASRSFLGRLGIRKPSLLSLSSATSNVSVTAVSPHTYENRTFSLDDLLRPSRSMMRTPSPHRRRNYSVQVRRDPAEKQQILQQLVSAGGSTSIDGESKPSTPKPTLAEIIQMSERRLRLASASSMQNEPQPGCSSSICPAVGSELFPNLSSLDTEETSFTTNINALTQAASKAEKKVTFARMLDKLVPVEILTSSSSCSDVSCAEDTKMVVVSPKPHAKKDRKGRFRRSKSYNNRGRNSETDQDYMDISSSDTTPDPICPPRFPTRLCISPTNQGTNTSPTSTSANNTLSISNSNSRGANPKIPKIASTDSLLALFRRFSGSNSAPPSPQYSENEESSAGVTPLSTPSSPRNSLSLTIRPPAFLITTATSPERNNTIELPVIDPNQWRNPPATSITLEVPMQMRDYCLSPIHEVPTPLATPSHSPCPTPMMRRQSNEHLPCIKIQSSEDDDGSSSTRSSSSGTKKGTPPPKILAIPVISISIEDGEEEEIYSNDNIQGNDFEEERKNAHPQEHTHFSFITGESEVIPDVLIHVPPDACVESHPEVEHFPGMGPSFIPSSPDCVTSPRIKTRPPALVFANEIRSFNTTKGSEEDRTKVIVPMVSIDYATPISESLPFKFSSPSGYDYSPGDIRPKCQNPLNKKKSLSKDCPLAPPMITINQSSEAESDSDTPAHKHLHRPNLCFLSPFAGTSDRVPSESNLSTSGYSSMASPCHSRCPSISPLCPSEAEDYHIQCSLNHNHHRRSSLTPGTTKKPPLTPIRRSSLNAPQIASGLLCDNADKGSELGCKSDEIETDSAVEIETDLDCLANMSEVENPSLTPLPIKSHLSIISEEMKSLNNLLEVPKKGMSKSKSLDINALDGNDPSRLTQNRDGLSDGKFDKKNYLRGPSLDSKLNSIDPSFISGSNGVTIVFPLSSSISNLSGKKSNSANLIEIPEEKERKLSPVSSRSESPLSELSAGCFNFFGSPLTDSDGVYDCGSSEVPTNNNENDTTNGTSRSNLLSLSRLNPVRRSSSGRNKDRRMIKNNYKLPMNPTPLSLNCETNESQNVPVWSVSTASPEHPSLDPYLDHGTLLVELPPNISRDNMLPNAIASKRISLKRRVRAQPNLDGSSSSSDSCVSSRPRSRTSVSSAQNSRNTSPLPMSLGASSILSPSDKSCEVGKRSSTSPVSPTSQSRPFVSHGGSLEEGAFSKSQDQENERGDNDVSTNLRKSAMSGSRIGLSPVRRKISRLRAISHQIRFLRRLELSLIRKKECLTQVTKGWPEDENRESILSHSDSAEDSSRCDTSESTSFSPETSSSESNSEFPDNEKPLLSPSTSSTGKTSGLVKQKRKNTKITPLNVLENMSARDFLDAHKKKVKKYK